MENTKEVNHDCLQSKSRMKERDRPTELFGITRRRRTGKTRLQSGTDGRWETRTGRGEIVRSLHSTPHLVLARTSPLLTPMPPALFINHPTGIHSLPVELLTRIFVLGASFDYPYASSPFLLRPDQSYYPPSSNFQVLVSHVCRHWREVALNTPSLWNILYFREPSDIDKAEAYLQRTSASPSYLLDILVDTVACEDHIPGVTLCREEIRRVFDVIIKHVRHWRSFHLKICDNECKGHARHYLGSCGPAPCMETLQLYHFEDYRTVQNLYIATYRPPVIIFDNDVPRIKNVSLIGVNLPWAKSPFLADLEDLELALHSDNIRPPYQWWEPMLCGPRLRKLSLHYSGPKMANGEPELAWPGMKDRMSLDHLEDLRLTDLDPDYLVSILERLVLPNLKQLHLNLPDQDFSQFVELMAGIHMASNPEDGSASPTTTSSSLHSAASDMSSVTLCDASSFLPFCNIQRLETLVITALLCDTSSWHSMLRAMTGLKYLEIDFSKVPADFVKVLNNKWKAHEDEHNGAAGNSEQTAPALLVPKLEVFKTCNLAGSDLLSILNFRASFCGLCKILRCVVKWNERFKGKENVMDELVYRGFWMTPYTRRKIYIEPFFNEEEDEEVEDEEGEADFENEVFSDGGGSPGNWTLSNSTFYGTYTISLPTIGVEFIEDAGMYFFDLFMMIYEQLGVRTGMFSIIVRLSFSEFKIDQVLVSRLASWIHKFHLKINLMVSSLPPESDYANLLQQATTTAHLLNTLSRLLRIPSLTQTVATFFRPILLDLCARWLDDEENAEEQLIALCLLLEVHEELYPILLRLLLRSFADGPLGFLNTEYLTTIDIPQLQRLLLAYYRILQANRELPMYLNWPLSSLSKLMWTVGLDSGSGMGEGERVDIEKEVFGELCGAECNLEYGQTEEGVVKWVDGWIMPAVEVRRIQEERDAIVTKTHEYFYKEESVQPISSSDLSPFVVDVYGILLVRSSTMESPRSALIPTPTSIQALRTLAQCISLRLPALLTSPPSAGKSLLLEHLAGEIHPQLKNQIITIHLADTSLDPRALLGTYISSPAHPGTFEWKEGALVRSMKEGKWVVFEDIEKGSNEVLGVIKPLVESLCAGKWIGGRAHLDVPGRGRVIAHDNFMLFATRSLQPSRHGKFPHPIFFGGHKFHEISIQSPNPSELRLILDARFPRLAGGAAQAIINVWDAIKALGSTASTRKVGLRELEKFCTRIDRLLPPSYQPMDLDTGKELSLSSIFTNPSLREDIYLESRDVFFGAGASTAAARAHTERVASIIAYHLGLETERSEWVLRGKVPELEIERDANGQTTATRIGRTRLLACQNKPEVSSRPFAMHKPAVVLVSRISTAISLGEPILLTGETGTGKTSVVSHLASLLRKPLISLNLSHQTESSDLIGGLKPLDARVPASALQEKFMELFGATFSRRKNETFESEVRKAVVESKWKRVVRLWKDSALLAKSRLQAKRLEVTKSDAKQPADSDGPRKRRKVDESLSSEAAWDSFTRDVDEFEMQHVQGKGKFAFGFVEGPLVKALRSGDWVLLDEANLASPETLECVSGLLQSPTASITLTEHDVGKKDLPPNIRSRFTEIDVPPPDADRDTLLTIVTQYIGPYAVGDKGPTSSGKTSSVEYLAKRTGHRFVRINNHEHTDIQEYIGSYVSDPLTGKLVFKDGLLVRALRNGDWIVLDELNLAPTDVLEALNRLLDDNRELVIPETSEIVRPHPHFMLFATQNPPGLYAGRKVLSRAFRNRFLEVHFEDVPQAELETILCQRCQIAPSYGNYKREDNPVESSKANMDLLLYVTYSAGPGAMLLERARREDDKIAVKEVIESVMGVRIDEQAMYELHKPEVDMASFLGCPLPSQTGLVWTKAMQRLYVLMARALKFHEPVLLVGETGSGKTLNCHQNTETADLIGGLRPIRNRSAAEADVFQEAIAVLESAGIRTDSITSSSLNSALKEALNDHHLVLECKERLQSTYQRSLRLQSIFDWKDGPLIESMRQGDVFLLDEISLADDSVLERLNSVLEPGRTIVLAEKGGSDSEDYIITAEDTFKLVATMNPGGDYGKKELSPALRNRFTEIWVPSINDREDLELIVKSLWEHSDLTKFTAHLLDFVEWLCKRVGDQSLRGLRDILAWVAFSNEVYNPSSSDNIQPNEIFHHAAHMTYLDGLSSLPQLSTYSKDAINKLKIEALSELQRIVPVPDPLLSTTILYNPSQYLQLGAFSIPQGPNMVNSHSFNLSAPTTQDNAMRIIRACQVPKPILLEGSPGVGKTSLITALANIAGHELCRINLSDQTDLMDLFGTDLPVEGGKSGEFAWKDAEFLKALQEGRWVLLDEMNLAPQAVLEGLNAVLDHRGTVYIPELGRSFERHPSFRIFAAQNPLSQGGGRKGLPKSFLNRFTKVYIEELSTQDLFIVCQHLFPQFDEDVLRAMISFNMHLHDRVAVQRLFAREGSPWEFNLRDVIRWGTLLSIPGHCRQPAVYLSSVYLHRFRTMKDRREACSLFDTVFSLSAEESLERQPEWWISDKYLQIGHYRTERRNNCSLNRPGRILKSQLSALQCIGNCVSQSWLAIITGHKDSGKTSLVRVLANITGNVLQEVSVNSATDTMDIIGSFEQVDHRGRVFATMEEISRLLDSLFQCATGSKLPESLYDIARGLCGNIHQKARDFNFSFRRRGRFEWVDGPLVQAMKSGNWLLLDGANLCNPSVLDRLNSLCEPNGVLILSERGFVEGNVEVIKPHPNFRLFMAVDPNHGELSRAMRNRGIEIFITASPHSDDSDILADHFRLPPSLVTDAGSGGQHLLFDAARRGLGRPSYVQSHGLSTLGRPLDQDSALSSVIDQYPAISNALLPSDIEGSVHFVSRILSPTYMPYFMKYLQALQTPKITSVIFSFLSTISSMSIASKLVFFREAYASSKKMPLTFIETQPLDFYLTVPSEYFTQKNQGTSSLPSVHMMLISNPVLGQEVVSQMSHEFNSSMVDRARAMTTYLHFARLLRKTVISSTPDFSAIQAVMRWILDATKHSSMFFPELWSHINALNEAVSLSHGLGLINIWTSLQADHCLNVSWPELRRVEHLACALPENSTAIDSHRHSLSELQSVLDQCLRSCMPDAEHLLDTRSNPSMLLVELGVLVSYKETRTHQSRSSVLQEIITLAYSDRRAPFARIQWLESLWKVRNDELD
ncbi:P-loop containing nucleoside triphosphate hydrolase protein [Cyathus striatus]|nr:P-loop containing nucleoside triphosphate hydrolase protein [Cyathus striatus]